MIALRLIMLLAAVAVIYMLFLRSQTPMESLPPELTQNAPAVSVAPGAAAPTVSAAHSQYKVMLDRAHTAAKQMQDQHAEADAAGN